MKKTRIVAMLLCMVTVLTLLMSVPAFADENGVDKVTLGKVTANALNLREEKSTSSKVLTVIPEGTKIAIAEKGSDGWSKVMIGGYVGYVSSKYVSTLEDGDASLSYGKLVGEVVYVREGPGTSYPIAAALVEGSYMKITGIETMSEGGVFNYANDVSNFSDRGMGAAEEAEKSAGTVVQAAKLIVSATVSIVFTAE